MTEEEKNKEISDRKHSEDQRSRKSNKNSLLLVLGLFLLLTIVTVVIIGYVYLGKSDYEKGNNYLKDKKFTEAIFEFQKVDPDNKDFGNAQSKINYINGLLSYNEDRKPEAVLFLSKVRTDDEYYHDAQLMLGKLNEASIGNDLQSQIDALKNNKDTVIIKKEVATGTPTKKIDPVDPVDPSIKADLEVTRKFVNDLENSISRFESLYQTARSAPLTTKSDYGKSLESVNKEFNNIKYPAQKKSPSALELQRSASEWMSRRIAFIRQLVSEKSVNETASSRSLKEEGDRLYNVMMGQLNKVKKSL